MKKLLSTGPGLVIGIPTLGRPVPLDWALALKGMNPPINFNVTYSLVRGKDVADARNAIAHEALKAEAKYLFFLGDDVVCPAHSIRQLIYRMDNTEQLGVVGGIYCSKCEPPAPLVFKENGSGSYWDWKIGEFFECSGLGMDCTLIRVDLFKKIKEPWFVTVDQDAFLDGENKAESWTEDLYFLKKVKEETDQKIYCDASVICEHWDVYGNKAYKLPKDSLPMRQKLVTRDKRALILGPSLDLADDSYDITRCSNNGDSCDYRVIFGNLPFDSNEFDFVIVSEPQTVDLYFEEWLRVTKPGGKLAVNLHSWMDPVLIASLHNATLDGTFLQIDKKVDSSGAPDNISVGS